MQYQITLDTFSGRPNPTWTLNDADTKALVSRLEAQPQLVRPAALAPAEAVLGYRGYIVEQLTEAESNGGPKLPAIFRIGGAGSEAEKFLLGTSFTAGTPVPEGVHDAVLSAGQAPAATPLTSLWYACASNYLTSDTDFSFWNAAAYLTYNNCYNFGSNYRTNTFAQPGRRSGGTGNNVTPAGLTANVKRDGYIEGCSSATITIAAVIWPNYDFHFYRLCINGHWCHKPGSTPARNYDNAGHWILDPRTANRGGYTTFVGFFYSGGGVANVR